MKRVVVALALSALLLAVMAIALPAGATPPANTGQDDLPDTVVSGGSDTTYLIDGDLQLLYNRSPGCPTNNSTTSADKGKCLASGSPGASPTANWDHDLFSSAQPTGSSAGVNALVTGGFAYNPPISYARSSRGPQGTELNDTTFWGFAQDGVAVYTFGARPVGNISGADLYGIYNCTITNWNQVAGYTGPAGPIFPYGIQSSSGTYAVFRDFLRTAGGNPAFDPNAQPCVRKVAGADGTNGTADDVYAFENDLKIQLNDKGPDNVAGTADDDPDAKLTWSSFSITRFPYLQQNAGIWDVNGVALSSGSIFSQSYPINRTVYAVTKNTDADCRQSPGTAGSCDNAGNAVYGAASGKGGAVRAFVQWLCRVNNAQHTLNAISGLGYKTEINNVIARNGFTQVPTAIRTTGYSCQAVT